MFKKATTVSFKGETRLRGKEAKRLREAVAARLGGEDIASALLPSKADVVLRKVGGGSSAQFVFVESECVLVQPDSRADVMEAELIPTLQSLWRVGTASAMLPVVLIQRPVAKFVFRGADVMAPGVHSVLPARGAERPPAVGALVAVVAVGNPSACAVGRLKVPAASLGVLGRKGEAVEVLHYFGDCLWEACGSPRPAGFVGDQVMATEAAAEGAASSGDEEEGDEDAAQAGTCDAAAVTADAASGSYRPPPRATGSAQAAAAKEEGAPAGESEAGGEEAVSPEAMSKCLEECFLQAAKTRLKDKDLPLTGNILYTQHMRPCRRAGTNLDVKASSFKKLVVFLTHCEGQGWIALKKNSPEPVVTQIFRDHPDMRDWKPWPKSVTAEASEASGEGGGGGAAGSRAGGGPVASIEVEPVWRVAKLKPLIQALGPEDAKAAEPEDGCWSRAECIAALKCYADRKELWQKQNRKRIEADALLIGLLPNGSGDQAAFSLEGIADQFLGGLPVCHRVAIPQGGAAGGIRRTVRQGKPPVVQVRTGDRRGHSVTLIYGLEAMGAALQKLVGPPVVGTDTTPLPPLARLLPLAISLRLPVYMPVWRHRSVSRAWHRAVLAACFERVFGTEAYGVDMEAFAACLQKALATAVAVEEATAQSQFGIMVQGFWDDACASWLEKIGVPADSVQNQAKKGQQQKKVKQASNIVKH